MKNKYSNKQYEIFSFERINQKKNLNSFYKYNMLN